MDAATETRPPGTLAMLSGRTSRGHGWGSVDAGWLGISATWQRRSFWTAENLLASAFYGDTAIRRGFAFSTLSGVALYLLLYSALGAVFAVTVRDRVPPMRILLLAVLFSVCWYYISYHWIWKSLLPLVYLLHTERSTVIGHLLYGTFLGRYPEYLKRNVQPTPALAAAPVEIVPENRQTD